MRHNVRLYEDAYALCAGLALAGLSWGDLYIWASETPAPITGVYGWLSDTFGSVFWNWFHFLVCLASVTAAEVIILSVRGIRITYTA